MKPKIRKKNAWNRAQDELSRRGGRSAVEREKKIEKTYIKYYTSSKTVEKIATLRKKEAIKLRAKRAFRKLKFWKNPS